MTALSFTLDPMAFQHSGSRYVVVVVYNDARKAPRVEGVMSRHAKLKQKHYIGVEDRHNNLVDRVAVYILEEVTNNSAVKNMLQNMERTGDIETIVKEY